METQEAARRAVTIYAESTPPGRGGVSVVRVAGPDAAEAARRLTGLPLPPPRVAALRRFRHPSSGRLLDEGLLLWFPAPSSFTAEESAELHLHGSPAVVAAVLDALAALPGLEPAQRGEFARRAFANGHLNLLQVEALSDLIQSDTEMQRRQALAGFAGDGGGLAAQAEAWKRALAACLARLEAVIEFPDEDTVAQLPRKETAALLGEVDACLAAARRGECVRLGLEVAITGAPNVGKSSVFNLLLGSERVLVSAREGTTRDVVEARLDVDGHLILLADMAGMRESGDALEAEGVRRARERAAGASARLILLSCEQSAAEWRESLAWYRAGDIVACNKCDLADVPERESPVAPLPLSARTGVGLDALRDALLAAARRFQSADAETMPPPRGARQRDILERVRIGLRESLDEMESPAGDVAVMAEGLRQANRALAHLVAPLGVEAMLDELFAEFCIGK